MSTYTLLFPFEVDSYNQGMKRTNNPADAIVSAMKCFLLTRPGSRRGNKIGSLIYTLKHKLIPQKRLSAVSNDIKVELQNQFRGVSINKVDIQLVKNNDELVIDLIITIYFSLPTSGIQTFTLQNIF